MNGRRAFFPEVENHDKHCPEAGNYDRATKNKRAREGPSRTREGHSAAGADSPQSARQEELSPGPPASETDTGRLPHRRHVVQLAGAGRQPAAQRALAVLRGQGLLLSTAPGTSRFAFNSFRKSSCAKPAGAGPVLLPQRLATTSCSSGSSRILVPRLSLSPQYCAGL